ALLSRLSGARERVGFSEYWVREPAAAVFYTERVGARASKHVVEEGLALAERLGVRSPEPAQWRFPLPHSAQDDACVERQLASLGGREFMVINPGGGWISKRWAPENYAELIRRLEGELPWHVFVTGSPDEEALVREI